MKDCYKLLAGVMLSALALGAIVPQATASIHYRAGIGVGADIREMSFKRPGRYHVGIHLFLLPLWYYEEGLATYDKVALNLTLSRYKTIGFGWLPDMEASGPNCVSTLAGVQCAWRNVRLSQDEDGITLYAGIEFAIDIMVGEDVAVGVYTLQLDAIAYAPEVTFEGNDFATMLVHD